MSTVVLGLGSNLSFGDLSPALILQKACCALSCYIKNIVSSCVYQTEPMYEKDQPVFLNMVVLGEYFGLPEELLSLIHKTEADFGRDRTKEKRNGPRTLDIDIELFQNVVLNTPNLVIPHQKMQERSFVLQPLVEVLEKTPSCFDVAKYKNMLLNIQNNKP